MASLYKSDTDLPLGYNAGNKRGLAYNFTKNDGTGEIDVVNDYTWTLTPSDKRKEIPEIRLTEYYVNETTIYRQTSFYWQGITGPSTDKLAPYENLFPKDKPSDFVYIFPYYSDINFQVDTPEWTSLDTLENLKKGATDLGSLLGGPAVAGFVDKALDLAGATALAGLGINYPKVGIMDRPKLWQSHNFRTYTVRFPLYNTVNTDNNSNKPEWLKNRELCELFVNQNLYNKRDWITGIPPVFYEVWIPGQHYSPAAAVSNITINNRGNIRLLTADGKKYNIPDAYDINITLTDLVIPSKNLFQAINDPPVTAR